MSAAIGRFARRKARLFLDGFREGCRWQLVWPILVIGVGTAVLRYGWFVAGMVGLAYVVGEGRGRKQGREEALVEVAARRRAAREVAAILRQDANRRREHLRILDVDPREEP